MASSEIASEASLRNYIDRPSSEQLRACSDVLSDALSGEGHISHCNRVLRLCHPEELSLLGLSLLYKKQIDSKLPCVCSVTHYII